MYRLFSLRFLIIASLIFYGSYKNRDIIETIALRIYNGTTPSLAKVNGDVIFYDDTKDDSKPPLLLIPGKGYDRKIWVKTIRSLKDKYRVISVDPPGYGNSTTLKEQITNNYLSSQLKQFIKKLNLKNINIVSHSTSSNFILELLNSREVKPVNIWLVSFPPPKQKRIKSKLTSLASSTSVNFIVGELDESTSRELIVDVVTELNITKAHIIPKAKNLPMLDNPDAFSDKILNN